MFVNRGQGTFLPAVSFAAGDGTCSLGVTDANGDGRPDLLAANQNSNDVSLLLNRAVPGPAEPPLGGGGPSSPVGRP
jgi:hypothetical protein